ncbi:hypothetical protein ACFX2H_013025 [Malus domestica]
MDSTASFAVLKWSSDATIILFQNQWAKFDDFAEIDHACSNLKLFEPPLLDDDPNEDTCLHSVDDLRKERKDHLEKDIILEQKVRETRYGNLKISALVRNGNFLASQSGITNLTPSPMPLISAISTTFEGLGFKSSSFSSVALLPDVTCPHRQSVKHKGRKRTAKRGLKLVEEEKGKEFSGCEEDKEKEKETRTPNSHGIAKPVFKSVARSSFLVVLLSGPPR